MEKKKQTISQELQNGIDGLIGNEVIPKPVDITLSYTYKHADDYMFSLIMGIGLGAGALAAFVNYKTFWELVGVTILSIFAAWALYAANKQYKNRFNVNYGENSITLSNIISIKVKEKEVK
jgi:hypothetical protein